MVQFAVATAFGKAEAGANQLSLEEQIVEWVSSRPNWQRAVLKRVSDGDVLTDLDYDSLVESLVESIDIEDTAFGLQQLPEVKAGDSPVVLISIAEAQHVNALESVKPLAFDALGLTIVYGDNGSGKSGYARLLKLIARARHQEPILTDVFRDTALAKPSALLTIKVENSERQLSWPEESPPELRRVLFYDQACGGKYVESESDFPYRPSALFVLDGLIQACVAVRQRVDARLTDNGLSAALLPAVDPELMDTELGKYVSSISAASSLAIFDELFVKSGASLEAIEDLKKEESQLRAADTEAEKQRLIRVATKLDALSSHIQTLDQVLGVEAIALLNKERSEVAVLREAASLAAKAFASEPLVGVGTSLWKELWESARRFSTAHAYGGAGFPVVGDDARCVVCQQTLSKEAKDRLTHFEQFVQDDTQTRLRTASEGWSTRVAKIKNLLTFPETVDTYLKDLETDHSQIVKDVRELCVKYQLGQKALTDALTTTEDGSLIGVPSSDLGILLQGASSSARQKANGFSDPQAVRLSLIALTKKTKELQLFLAVNNDRALLATEIQRLAAREHLEAVKSAAATGPITKKIGDLSEDNITEVVRNRFTRETDRLNLERVTITRTRADKGTLLHQPKMVGARQDVTLPRVFSEGERTALGLAAFFTEAHLDASQSALILDDPVTSLDHIRRGRVASRLADIAQTRQVIVFTHDVSFVADLKREAKGLNVPLAERSVSRGRGGDRKPGSCGTSHPWKAKDVSERLGLLKTDLAGIKRDATGWSEETYEKETASWAGNLSETWERMFSQELVGQILADGGLEVRPSMMKILVQFSLTDDQEFQASYSRVSQWAKRHDKSGITNYVAPDVKTLEEELERVNAWFKRIKAYKN